MISSVQIHLTNRCNRCCSHCLFLSNRLTIPELSPADWINFFAKNSSYISPRCNVNIFGGEPFLYKKIYDLIYFLNKKKLDIGITTNASARIDKIYRSISLGVKRISVDISSTEIMIHDQLKPKTFTNTLYLLKSLENSPVNVYINIVIHRDNYSHIEKILDFINKYKVDNVSIYSLTEIGQAKHSKYKMVNQKIWGILKQRVKNWLILNNPTFSLVWENSYLDHPLKKNYKLCAKASTHSIDIRADGNVYFCCLLMAEHISEQKNNNSLLLGNIISDSLEEIIERRENLVIEKSELCPVIRKLPISENKKRNFWCPYDWEFMSIGCKGNIGYMGG
ncbi:radical SAM protein [Brenneria rubrifaciens]|uniref:Radical SAM protein n=1 Tax=Brenneria rubrifaciens TaxID=55213 RepID=A0A4P8QS15_9GAMM|nr:radical SAM protein [Brenneria rubrifaciens]QCR08130.1 radical SAM protein [Brenneria rubrifaciens]